MFFFVLVGGGEMLMLLLVVVVSSFVILNKKDLWGLRSLFFTYYAQTKGTTHSCKSPSHARAARHALH